MRPKATSTEFPRVESEAASATWLNGLGRTLETAVDVGQSEGIALELLGGREGWAALKERGRADRLTPMPDGFGVSFTSVEGAHRRVCVAREADGTHRVSVQRLNTKPRATALFEEDRSETALTLEEARRLVWLETGAVHKRTL